MGEPLVFKTYFDAKEHLAMLCNQYAYHLFVESRVAAMTATMGLVPAGQTVYWASGIAYYSDLANAPGLPRQTIRSARNAANAGDMATAKQQALQASRSDDMVAVLSGAPPKDPDLQNAVDRAYAQASTFRMVREGFFWDLAGGLVLDYMDRRFDNSYITKAGLWTSLGNNSTKTNITYQAQLRYLFQPDNAFMGEADTLEMRDIHLADGGARFSWDPNNGRFSISLEALYRACLNVDAIEPTWRLVTNADYDLGNNKRLTFSFGRNFDGTTSKDGNLVSALNLVLGFGHKNSTKVLR
jgi:hypothetical protein